MYRNGKNSWEKPDGEEEKTPDSRFCFRKPSGKKEENGIILKENKQPRLEPFLKCTKIILDTERFHQYNFIDIK